MTFKVVCQSTKTAATLETVLLHFFPGLLFRHTPIVHSVKCRDKRRAVAPQAAMKVDRMIALVSQQTQNAIDVLPRGRNGRRIRSSGESLERCTCLMSRKACPCGKVTASSRLAAMLKKKTAEPGRAIGPVIAHRDGQAKGQHAREMHGPDANPHGVGAADQPCGKRPAFACGDASRKIQSSIRKLPPRSRLRGSLQGDHAAREERPCGNHHEAFSRRFAQQAS